jgi:gluconate 5-dehydrogenase
VEQLRGRNALVTGAGGGLGAYIARALAGEGVNLAVTDLPGSSVDGLSAELRTRGVQVEHAPADLTDRDERRRLASWAAEALGPIDILVNNAGVQNRTPILDFPDDEWHRLVDTNLGAAFRVGREVARRMQPRGRGKIVNICSVQSEAARPGTAVYAATKGGLKMLTKGMCADLGPSGIQVNGLGPGYIATELTAPLIADPQFDAWIRARTPAGRWGSVDDLVGPLLFLVSPAADYVNGQILTVDGGMLAVL